MPSDPASQFYHTNLELFREALTFTEAQHGFVARLIEKDYFCSLVLQDFSPLFDLGLTFKGGTALSKVHAGFYRLSEDLDFVLHVELAASRATRRRLIDPIKRHVETLPERLPVFQIAEPLQAHSQSTQYIGQLLYASCITGTNESIKIEVGLREPILQATFQGMARTILTSPLRMEPVIGLLPVRTLSLLETYAEKIRAALSRREPAIRDFFDLDYAIRHEVLPIADLALADLAVRKLQVSGHDSIDISDSRLTALRLQLDAQLRPVLRDADYRVFDLDRTFDVVRQLLPKLPQEFK